MNRLSALLMAIGGFLYSLPAFSQVPTVEGSQYIYLYNLEKQHIRWMLDSNWLSPKNAITAPPVDSIPNYTNSNRFVQQRFRRGYYLSVSTRDLMLDAYVHIYQPFFPIIQETNGKWWFVFKDTMQAIVKGGTLTMIDTKERDSTFSYDSSCMCYQVPVQKYDRWFVFEKGNDFYYLKVNSPYKKIKKVRRHWWKIWRKRRPVSYENYGGGNYRYRARLGRRIISWIGRRFERPVTPMQINPGYMVMNQPEFKHYDTLKMKSFLVNRKGRPLKKDLTVKIHTDGYVNGYYARKEFINKKVTPITKGAYALDFAIPDSMDIDKIYTIEISDKKGRVYKSQTFKVADYELKKVSYSWEKPLPEYYRGNDIIFFARSVDANNLPLPDATVRLKLKIVAIDAMYDTLFKLHDSVFTVWYDTLLSCSPDGITPIHLPQSLLPNADLRVYAEMIFTNADNQPGYANANFSILANSKRYYIQQDSNGLSAGYLIQGRDQHKIPARWKVEYVSGVKKEKQITLPYYQDWEPGASIYVLFDTAGQQLAYYQMPAQIPQIPHFTVEKTYDSLNIEMENPLGIEVGWRLFSGKDLIEKGAGTSYRYHKKLRGTNPVYMVYSYTWAGNFYTYETVAWVKEKQLTVKVEQPETVFPGQDIAVDITVNDYKNKGARGVNLTAYSVNMEFENIPEPQLPYYGKYYGGNLVKFPISGVSDWTQNYAISQTLTDYTYHWLKLAQNPYYKLMYSPKAIGVVTDSLAGNKTQLSLYVKNPKNGIRGYHTLWVDDTMRYYGLNGVLPNAFTISPGKHNIKVRGYEGLYEIKDIECVPGMRILLGLNLDSVYNNTAIRRTELTAEVSKEERALYQQNLLYIAPDYTNSAAYYNLQQAYLRQGSKLYKLADRGQQYQFEKNSYYIMGPFEPGPIEMVLPDTVIRFYFNSGFLYTMYNKRVHSKDINYHDYIPPHLGIYPYSFRDTAMEFPVPPPPAPTVNYIPNYNSPNPVHHPGIRSYNPPHWEGKGGYYHLYFPNGSRINQLWFINNDSMEMSVVYSSYVTNQFQLRAIPGNYDIVLITDTNSYKVLRNVQVDDSMHVYWRPAESKYLPFDSAVLMPYFIKVKILNRGPIPAYYNRPVKVIVRPEREKMRVSEKVIGEFSINGQYAANALVVIEDGKGNYINGGLTNQFGFYQIPLRPGTYFMKIYTPNWDMFYVEYIQVEKGFTTIVHLRINGYTAAVATSDYNNLSQSQKQELLNSRGGQPGYYNTVVGDCYHRCGEVRGKITDASTGEELIGATITIKGTTIGAASDGEGYYRIKGLSAGTATVVITFLGYQTQEITNVLIKPDQVTVLNVQMRENAMEVDEVTVTSGGYLSFSGARSSNSYSWNADAVSEETIKSVPERQVNAIANMAPAISVVERKGKFKRSAAPDFDGDGVEGEIDDREPFSGNTYGDIMTQDAVGRNKETERLKKMVGDSSAMRIRKTFRDYGYWVPNLITNNKGKAGFTVRLPDNQTQWLTYVPAMDGKKRTGLGTAYMKAYKPLTGNLSVPRVMVAGDRLQITGKTVNYTADSVVVNALLRVNDKELFNSALGLRYYQLVQQFLQPDSAGQTMVQFSIKMENGYTDGELREVPVLENGLLVNEGETRTLEDKEEFALYPHDGYKNRELLLSNRKMDMLLGEINKLKYYHYGCVEQTASKLKALLLEKQFAAALGTAFKDEKLILTCIKRLEKYQNNNGSWGWWEKTATDNWMTVYATDALLRAIKAGYKSSAPLNGARYLWDNYYGLPVSSRLTSLELFINSGYGAVTDKISGLDTLNLNLQERYTLMKAKQVSGLKINTDTLLKTVRQINAKQATWGEKVFSISVNELQTSAIAYEILRKEGGHDSLLRKVRNYFLSKPHTSRNTIESATVLQTFMQDIATEDNKRQELTPQYSVNNTAPTLPLKMAIGEKDTVKISKDGSELFYLYSWQNFVANPDAKNSVFDIKSWITQGQHTGDTVEAGKPITLHVTVSVEKEKEYVVVEVPIPAGFSYQSKHQGSGYEIHREHFDDKVSVFFGTMPRGRYYFDIELLPKFKGEVTLLPAHAEEMYFPMNFGNNAKRMVVIR